MSDLPEGWAETEFGLLLASSQNGLSARSGTGTPTVVLRLADVSTDGDVARDGLRFIGLDTDAQAKYSLQAGDLLAFRVNGSPSIAGQVIAYRGTPGYAYCDHFIRFRLRSQVAMSNLIAMAFRSNLVRHQVEQRMVSSAGQNTVSQSSYREIEIPLPPLAEQFRIIEKVEALLADVNAARDRLAKVPALLKRFRQSVLAAACSGRLTEDWGNVREAASASDLLERVRQLRSKSARRSPLAPFDGAEFDVPEHWGVASLDELALRLTSGSRAWSKYYRDNGSGTFVMAQNVRPLRFDQTVRQGVEPPPDDPERLRTKVAKDDLLITIVGANTGDVCRVPVEVRDHYVCQSVALARPVMSDLSPYLELFLNSPAHGRGLFEEWIYGEGRPHLSFDQLRATPIALPPLPEQFEIVRRVGALFLLADAIDARVAAATVRADKLTQAILAKAFRGELVPTEAELARRESRDYEPASLLLERVRAHGGKVEPKRSGRKRASAKA